MTLETMYGKEPLISWASQVVGVPVSSQEPTLVQVFPMFLLHVCVVAGVKSFGPSGSKRLQAAVGFSGRRQHFTANPHFMYKHVLHFHVVLICCLKAPSLPLPTRVSTSRPSNLQLQQLVPTLQSPDLSGELNRVQHRQFRDWKQKKPPQNLAALTSHWDSKEVWDGITSWPFLGDCSVLKQREN